MLQAHPAARHPPLHSQPQSRLEDPLGLPTPAQSEQYWCLESMCQGIGVRACRASPPGWVRHGSCLVMQQAAMTYNMMTNNSDGTQKQEPTIATTHASILAHTEERGLNFKAVQQHVLQLVGEQWKPIAANSTDMSVVSGNTIHSTTACFANAAVPPRLGTTLRLALKTLSSSPSSTCIQRSCHNHPCCSSLQSFILASAKDKHTFQLEHVNNASFSCKYWQSNYEI